MTEVPTAITQADIVAWYKLQEQLTEVKAAEAMLRARIFRGVFANPVEGTNTYDLDDGTGFVLKGGRVVNRKVLEDEVESYKTRMKEEGSNLPKFKFDKLIRWKPELVKSEYNKLTDEERHQFDSVLEIKDGTPSLEIVKPKRG
jgi:hypothetical protein